MSVTLLWLDVCLDAGLEYIEEGMNDAGTAPSFFCKLCDCSFTDIMGKLMHAKGRRHRLAYKVLWLVLYLLLCLSFCHYLHALFILFSS